MRRNEHIIASITFFALLLSVSMVYGADPVTNVQRS